MQKKDLVTILILVLFTVYAGVLFDMGKILEGEINLILGLVVSFLYEVYGREKSILEEIKNEIAEVRRHIPIAQRIERPEMYKEGRRFVEGAQDELLVVQRTPSLFFPEKEYGKEEEKKFKKSMMRTIAKITQEDCIKPKIIYAFSVYDPYFTKELFQTQDPSVILKNIITALEDNRKNNNYTGRFCLLPLNPETTPRPLIVSDEKIAIWVTDIAGHLLYISYSDKKDARDIIGHFETLCENSSIEYDRAIRYLKKLLKNIEKSSSNNTKINKD